MSKAFFDTNVLVYSLDSHDPGRQSLARELLRTARAAGQAVISTQVMQELFAVATRKLSWPAVACKRIVEDFLEVETVSITPKIVLAAMDIVIVAQLSVWDALILAAAQDAKCSVLYTEDLQGGSSFGGVRIVNPFA